MARKVLILEDELGVAEVYALSLRGAGFDVTVHTTFEEARDAMRQDLPDVLLTDVRVGEYNGLQLAILFRSMSADGKIAVVTGHDDPVIRQEADRVGAIFITKPVNLRSLTDLISR